MKTALKSFLQLGTGCFLFLSSVQAAVIYNVGSTGVAPGANFSVAITATVSDLTGDHIYWGNAGFNLTWDPSVLTLQPTSVTPGSALPLDAGDFRSPTAGQLNFTWFADDLGTAVSSGSTLFTLNFTAVGGANSYTALTFGNGARIGLLDAAGDDHGVYTDPSFVNGRIEIVPEPVNCALAGLGCVFLGVGTVRLVSRKAA